MDGLPLLNEDDLDLLVSYSLSSEEEMVMGVINAFYAANIDVSEKPTQLHDWIDADVFDVLQESSKETYLYTRIWGHQVVITGEAIRIYA